MPTDNHTRKLPKFKITAQAQLRDSFPPINIGEPRTQEFDPYGDEILSELIEDINDERARQGLDNLPDLVIAAIVFCMYWNEMNPQSEEVVYPLAIEVLPVV